MNRVKHQIKFTGITKITLINLSLAVFCLQENLQLQNYGVLLSRKIPLFTWPRISHHLAPREGLHLLRLHLVRGRCTLSSTPLMEPPQISAGGNSLQIELLDSPKSLRTKRLFKTKQKPFVDELSRKGWEKLLPRFGRRTWFEKMAVATKKKRKLKLGIGNVLSATDACNILQQSPSCTSTLRCVLKTLSVGGREAESFAEDLLANGFLCLIPPILRQSWVHSHAHPACSKLFVCLEF